MLMSDLMAAADTAIRTVAGPITTLTPLEVWGPTLVVAATLHSGDRVVLKASALQDVRVEAAIARRVREAGVPAPEVLAEGADERLPGGYWFLMRHAGAHRWCDTDWSPDQHQRMLNALAGILHRLHGIRISGSGPLNLEGRGTFADWHGYLVASLATAIETLGSHGTITSRTSVRIHQRFDAFRDSLETRPSVLLHADLGDGEVFIDPAKTQVTGIVDWGSSVAGDPLYEFARFVAGGPDDDPRPARFTPPLVAAYRRFDPTLPSAESPLPTLYRLHNTILNAAWSTVHAADWLPALTRRIDALLVSLEATDIGQ